MSFLTRRRLGFCAVMLLFTILYLQFAHAQSSDGSVTATAGAPSPNSVAAGQPVTIALSATATPPTVAYPDSIVSGPEWSWKGMGPGSPQINQPDPYSANATMTVKTDQPGVYSMSATATATWTTKMGMKPSSSGMTNMVTATVVGVDKLQYLGKDGYVDIMGMMGPLYVLVGSSVTFHAVAAPNGVAFPDGQLVWSGAASGTGDTVKVTFNTVSLTSVVATCGSSSVTANIQVYDLIPKKTPQDNFEGRDLGVYGVCELIDLSFETIPSGIQEYQIGGLQWIIDSGGGEITGGAGGNSTYECPDVADTIVLAIQLVGGPSAGEKKEAQAEDIIGPDGVSVQKQADTPLFHINLECSAGFCGDIYTTRKDKKKVSFDKIHVREGQCQSKATGWLLDRDGYNHPSSAWFNLKALVADKGYQLDFSAFLRKYDRIGGTYGEKPFGKGTFTWPIPYEYKKKDIIKGGIHDIATANHEAVTTDTGRYTIRKAGSGDFFRDPDDEKSIPIDW